MTFANTLTLTIDGAAKTLNRRNQDNFGSAYQMKSGTERIDLLIRHTVDTVAGKKINRHNMFLEWTIFATPTANEQYYSSTYTLREGEVNDPATLDKLSVGILALAATLDTGLTIGEN